MLRGYDQSSYTERALELLEKDISYLAHENWGYGMTPDDVRQELRLQLWRKLHLYDPRKKSIRTWAQQVMRNRLNDMWRYTKRPTRIPLELVISFEIEEWIHNESEGVRGDE